MYLEHHCDFLNSGTSATAGKLNSTIIKGYKKILGKFAEIQREFVDVYSPDSDNDCHGGAGGHQHLHPPECDSTHSADVFKDSCTRRRNPACSGTARIRLLIRRSLFRQDRSSKRRDPVWKSLPIRLTTPGLDFVQRRVDLSHCAQSYRTDTSPYGDLRRAEL